MVVLEIPDANIMFENILPLFLVVLSNMFLLELTRGAILIIILIIIVEDYSDYHSRGLFYIKWLCSDSFSGLS